ncbi:MAG TPA: toxin-antitoxin system antitoxin subunit [Lachnospiraceae bacterium]|nr:toxin-antitoxin system antitoxin subunit [Lachnospiraceae bacterium]
MDVRSTNRYHSFCNSLEGLKKARFRDPHDEFVLSGTIQKYSLTFDISWKVMKDILVKYHGIQSFATGSLRETLRAAHGAGLIESDTWMDMLEDRNNLAHDYDGVLATACFGKILTCYVETLDAFCRKAAAYFTVE